METLSEVGGGALLVKVVQAFWQLILPGFITSWFFIHVLVNMYIGSKYYGSTVLGEFDIPTRFDEMGKIVEIAWIMLTIKVNG